MQRIGLLSLFIISVAAHVRAADNRPNFLLIIADDACWRDFGFVGNPDVQTPHIDRLAAEGMSLEGMFTPAATCSPARHALYTGLFSVRSGAYPNHTRVYDGTKSLFTYLKEAGYRVGLQNKSHVGTKASFPYENVGKGGDDFAASKKFMTRDADQPWLLVFASNDPHSPWTRGPKELYDPAKLTIPPYLHDNVETRSALAKYYAEISQLDGQVGQLLKILADSDQVDDTLVMFVSEQGSSFPYGGKWSLQDNGIRITTVVRWPGKVKAGSTSDALVQYVDVAPTFLEAAGIDPEKIDTGCPDAKGDRGFDGRSFLDVLTGKADKHRDYVFAQHTAVGVIGYKEPYPIRAVRDGRYKLIRNLTPENEYWIRGIHGSPLFTSWQRDAANDPKFAKRVDWLLHRTAEELYDLDSDPYETNNLADDPKQADVKARLGKQLDAWMTQQGDKGLETELAAKSRQGRGRKNNGKKKQQRTP